MSFCTIPCSDIADYEVVVVGAGSAGATAAITAARSGAKTMLIERLPFAGGTSTAVLDTFYGFYIPGKRSLKVVGGIPDQVIEGLGKYGHRIERPNTFGAGTGITYHPEYLKVVWEDLLKRSNVSMLLHAQVVGIEREGGRITAVIVATKSGNLRISARIVIDASGDADICRHGGFSCEMAGEHEPAQTLTTTFRMVGVDQGKRARIPRQAFQAMMAEAAESGYSLPRKEGSDHITTVPGMTATIMTRLPSFRTDSDGICINAIDPGLLTAAEIEGRRQALEYVRFLRDRVPGYELAHLAAFGVQIGVRETARAYGDYRLTREDVLTARQFPDQIGLSGAPIEDHHDGADTAWQYLPEGRCVGIPLRALLVRDAENLLVAGRCFSATHDAHASVRSMGQCMAMGQAAGMAAALAVQDGRATREIPFSRIREALLRIGAVLEVPT